MDRPADVASAPHYRAFISYSHADAKFAGWLHRQLEATMLPDADGRKAERLAPVFIDHAELPAGPDLPSQVRAALADSAALVVVASPSARASRWVAQEIALFRSVHPDRPVLAALIAGEPDQAFPAALLEADGATLEPLAADFREGRDERRLGLLKIVAGLTAQPLDRLVQRDASARQRRVMAVTAGALILSIVLATLLAFALRARAEAERQRAEAEGMVEFMLTDLRDRLQGVGSLRAMAAVNQRALSYYTAQDLSRLPDASLDRRARVLHAMGEDDERLGNFPAALDKYREARRITAAVLSRRPDDPEAIFAHAQSEYWTGEAAWRQSDLATTAQHWRGYLDQAKALERVQPGTRRTLMELGYAEGNLCELTVRMDRALAQAQPHCQRASSQMRAALALDPDNAETAMALANRLGWQADVELKAGRSGEAITLRHEESAIIGRLLEAEPDNREYQERRLWPEIGRADALLAKGRDTEAIRVLKDCLTSYDRIAAERSDDTMLTEQRLRVISKLAAATRDSGLADAASYAARTRQLYQELRRNRTAAEMVRFDKMIAKLEEGEKQ